MPDAVRDHWDVTVVGGGAAGLSSAAQLARTGARVRVVEANMLGGQLANLTLLQEDPLTDRSAPAWDIVQALADRLEAAGGQFEFGQVHSIERSVRGFNLTSEALGTWGSTCIVLATGSVDGHLEIDGAAAFEGRGVSHCADCDGPLFRDGRVAVLGRGRPVLWEAIALAETCSEVMVFDFSSEMLARERTANGLRGLANVTMPELHRVIGIDGHDRVEALRYQRAPNLDVESVEVEAVFVALRKPSLPPEMPEAEILDCTGFVSAGPDLAVTGAPGVFAAGDARRGSPMHLASTLGDAVQVCDSVVTYLDGSDT